jgi:hypothetical protein
MTGWDQDELLLQVVIGLLAVAGIYFLFFYRRSDFRIRVHGRHVECQGKLPIAHQQAVAEFLREDLTTRARLTIWGARHGKQLVLWFSGPLSTGEKQRIRNFLMSRV